MAGIKIVAKDSKGIIKQDYELSRTNAGKIITVDEYVGKKSESAKKIKK